MGRDWIQHFKVSLSHAVYTVTGWEDPDEQDNALKEVLSKHETVFLDGPGIVRGFRAKLHVDPEAKPKFLKARSVPFSMRNLVESELERLQQEGTISPAQFSHWASPIVPVMKQNGTVRVCGDYKATLNPVLQVDTYPLPRVDELFASLSGGCQFTKLNMSQTFLQLELEEESKPYLTINTHKGLFQYNRLPFGVASVPAIFQRCMESFLQGCKGVCVYQDDILVTGKTWEEDLANLDEALGRLGNAGIHLNRQKCLFMHHSVEYLGHVIDSQGLHPTKEKVRAIREAPRPQNVSELRAFLGILNYYHRFLPNLSMQLAPLHVLLQKRTKWQWGTAQEKAFQTAKAAVQTSSL